MIQNKRKFGKSIIKTCVICNIQFGVHNCRRNIAKYCSKKCWYERNGIKIKKICLQCKKEYIITPKRKDSTFCSHQCHSLFLKGKLNIALQTGRQKIKGKNHPMWGKHHTEETKRKISLNHADMSGNNSPSWKGGITPINERIRKSKRFIEWAKAIKERDNYICVICKTRGGKLHSDHIKPFSLYPELRFELSNGQTLCKNCHLAKTSIDMILIRKESNIWMKN